MKPLHGKRILITRAAHQSNTFKRALADQGADVICLATIKIVDPPDWRDFDQAVQNLKNFDWLLFSSANAVIRTVDRINQLKIGLESIKKIKIAAVGRQTAAALESFELKVDLVPANFQAEDLALKMLENDLKGKRILIPRALHARDYLAKTLQSAGAEIDIAPVYQNAIPAENCAALEETIKKHEMDWITFTSSSTAGNFIQMLSNPIEYYSLPKIASIGEVTTQTLKDNNISPQVTAKPQNIDGMVAAIVKWENDH